VARSIRILRLSLAVLSLLLCLAIQALWIRGYFVGDHFDEYSTFNQQNRSYRPIHSLQIGRGGIGFCRTFWSGPIGSLDGVQGQPLSHRKGSPLYPRPDSSQ
jgi:hypothetical protein